MILENWYVLGQCIVGEVYSNPLFEDGTFIRTSTVQSVSLTSVKTLNSTYRLGVPDHISEWTALKSFPTKGEQA
jgi:hypothetical protein